MEAVGEAAAASVVEVAVKEPKQVSTWVGKDVRHAHWEDDTRSGQLSGGETWQIRMGATQAVVG
jgi:hypothetical protein